MSKASFMPLKKDFKKSALKIILRQISTENNSAKCGLVIEKFPS